MSSRREEELESYPKYKANYMRAFERLVERRIELGKDKIFGGNAQSVMDWYLEKTQTVAAKEAGQIDISEVIGSE